MAIAIMLSPALAEPATTVLGRDFVFPTKIEGMPAKLSDFPDLKINSFTTNDGVKLSYWEAGSGKPLVFVPGWSASGADYFYVMWILSRHYHVFVLDPRNQGLSQHVEYGLHISRFAMDLKEFTDHLGLAKASFCGWSMGASIVWNYIDLFGTSRIDKVAFVDEPPSIYSHADWTEQQRLDAGGFVSSIERTIDAYTGAAPANRLISAREKRGPNANGNTAYYDNMQSFSKAVILTDMPSMRQILFDHMSNDWRDVIRHKIDIPAAIFTGENSDWLASQRWIKSTVPKSVIYEFTKDEGGDHQLLVRNPVKFSKDLTEFLDAPE